jgi:hypothetical protein
MFVDFVKWCVLFAFIGWPCLILHGKLVDGADNLIERWEAAAGWRRLVANPMRKVFGLYLMALVLAGVGVFVCIILWALT